MLIDDRPVAGLGLSEILTTVPDLEIVGTASDVEVALDMLLQLRPDVVVVDTGTADAGTFVTIRAVRRNRPESAVLLISDNRSSRTALLALGAGTSGYLSTRADAELIVQAVRTVGARGLVLPGSLAETVAGRPIPDRNKALAHLTTLSRQEQRVLEMLADGQSNSEIAQNLYISQATVKKHLSQVLRKLGLRDRLQAGLYAYRIGLASGDGPSVPDGADAAAESARR